MSPALSREWFTAADLAALALPGLPSDKRAMQRHIDAAGWQAPDAEDRRWRRRQGRGGGVEYHYSLLPLAARAKLALDLAPPAAAPDTGKAQVTREERWEWFARQAASKRKKAQERLQALDAIEALVRAGTGRVVAMQLIARQVGASLSTLYTWDEMVRGIARADWLPYLAPGHTGTAKEAECAAEAWEALKADYLRPEKPAFSDCYRRLQLLAAQHGWTIPSARTLERRMAALPKAIVTLARDGDEALKRLYPAQQRDRGVFHALEAVNADGHQWDVFVRWPDGSIGRPVMLAFQDLYSGKVLAWRVDRSENADAFRLAFGDVVEQYGIPDHVWIDNTRAAANKWMTGGVGTRFRFKVTAEDPTGIFPLLGVEVHWTRPYSGQSKPIERAFRDFATGLAKHPAFAGAYSGNSPAAKPANYGQAAVELDTFLRIVGEGLAEHNARAGRQGGACRGRSFDQVFTESLEQHAALIRRATAAQRRLWLLAAEAVVVRTDGSVHLAGNRYWSDGLLGLIGHKVTLRFDPEALHEPLHVYRLDGAYLGQAECQEAAGFADTAAARRHGLARRRWLRAQKEMLEHERQLSIQDLAAMLRDVPAAEPAAPPETRVVRAVFGNTALKASPEPEETPVVPSEAEALLLRALRARIGPPRLVPNDETGGE